MNKRAYCCAVFSVQKMPISVCLGVRAVLSAAPKMRVRV